MHRQKIESEEQGVEPPLLPYFLSLDSVYFSVPSVSLWLALSDGSGEYLRGDVPGDIGQPEVTPRVAVRQLLVVQAHERE